MPYIAGLKEICSSLGCEIKENCVLSDYVTFRFGGACRALISVNSTKAVAELAKYLNENKIKYTVLGRGSNIIVPDEGYDGVVLLMGNDFSEIEINGSEITSQAGAMLASVCIQAQKNALTGMENLYGIPGTMGGALYMNAGAYGSEICDVVTEAEYVEPDGSVHKISKEDMKLSYRRSLFMYNSEKIITSVTVKLSEGNAEEIKSAMTECMQKRTSKQPLEYPSAGSTFKRPEGSYASLLIDQCGLKGMNVGGAQVSEKHGGFVINKGGATCADVLELCRQVKEIVLEKTGYTLELEPVILE